VLPGQAALQAVPLRALAEGTLPPGYTVKKRRLVKLDKADKVLAKGTRKAA
jgi:hypothetical protein